MRTTAAESKNASRLLGRTLLTALALLVIGVGLFSQSSGPDPRNAPGSGKLEASLEFLDESMLPPGDTVGVIVQFEDDAMPGDTAELKNQKKLARRAAILATGGEADRDYDSFPAHWARLTFRALKQLEKHPRLKRISVDHAIKGIAGLLLMPPTRHCILHLNEGMRLRRAIRGLIFERGYWRVELRYS